MIKRIQFCRLLRQPGRFQIANAFSSNNLKYPHKKNPQQSKREAEELWKSSRPEHQKAKYSEAVQELQRFLHTLDKSHFVMNKCSKLGMDMNLFEKAAREFRQDLLEDRLDYIDTDTIVMHHLNGEIFDRTVIPYLFKFVQQNYKSAQSETFQNLVVLSELKNPGDSYPEARKMNRKIIMHVGPTNSGKTYHALQRFRESQVGIYCGPLRLLAHEVYDRCNSDGIACNLLTGEERKESDEVYRWSSTVEMANKSRKFDVAVIDEIQMIADPQRGWAWTEAFYGIQANEVHLCGEPSAVPLIQKLCADIGEEVEVKTYERLTGLEIDQSTLKGDLANVQKGDCVIAFSRRDIFSIKSYIEKKTKLKAAVIYGNLPPETRAEQAKLFNNPNSNLSVLVASDAIGMGLNLYNLFNYRNIRRIVFTNFKKFNGKEDTLLTLSQGKQIAGRAGRFGTKWENGLVTTVGKEGLATLKQYVKGTPKELNTAGLAPNVEQIEKLSLVMPDLPLYKLLQQFEQLATVSGDFFLCNIQQMIETAELLESVDLPLRDKFVFLQAPVNVRDEYLGALLRDFALSYKNGKVVSAHRIEEAFPKFDSTKLTHLEVQHRAIMLYLWLAIRFEATFVEADKVQQMKLHVEEEINRRLTSGMKMLKGMKSENDQPKSTKISTKPHVNREDEY